MAFRNLAQIIVFRPIVIATAEIIAWLKRDHSTAVLRRLVHLRRCIRKHANRSFWYKQLHIVPRNISGCPRRHSGFCFDPDALQHMPFPCIFLASLTANARK